MVRHYAKVKRVSLINFEQIKVDICSGIEFADSNIGNVLYGEPKKTSVQIYEERRNLHAQLARVQKTEILAKQAPQFFQIGADIPWNIGKYYPQRTKQDFHYVVFHDLLYECSGPYTEDEFKALVIGEFDRERRYFESLHCHGQDESSVGSIRERIAERVRVAVWRRDGGKCTRCGSRENIEFDHIVPVSRGGSNTARNIELLCEKCNRSKGSSIR